MWKGSAAPLILLALALGGCLGGHQHPMGDAPGTPADAGDATRTIRIRAIDTAFDPTAIEVALGETVTFHVTNEGAATHEFVLGTREMQEQHERGMEHGMTHEGAVAIELAPGESKEVTWRFDEPGTVLYGCHEPGHFDAGMWGEIAIGEGAAA